MISRDSKGFTLIELLVVISIISLLSSVVLAALNSARDRGRGAAGQQFSTSLYHVYGADAAASFDFEEGLILPALDSSGNSKDLSLVGTTDRSQTTADNSQYSLSCKGGDTNYAWTSPKTVTITGTWTYAAWVKPSSTTGSQIFLSFGGHYLAFSSGRFYVYWTGASPDSLTDATSRSANTWYHVAVTHRNSDTTMYVDGKEVSRKTGQISNGVTAVLYICRHTGAGYSYTGLLDDVNVYNDSLLSSDIQNLYAKGLNEHSLAINN